jgi:Zn finger protein HypA/HybF involved in hydrogenase expression
VSAWAGTNLMVSCWAQALEGKPCPVCESDEAFTPQSRALMCLHCWSEGLRLFRGQRLTIESAYKLRALRKGSMAPPVLEPFLSVTL